MRTWIAFTVGLAAVLMAGCDEVRDVLNSRAEVPDSDAAFDAGGNEPGFSLAAGFGHVCAVVRGGLSCWGDNASGQLGTGDATSRSVPTRVGTASDWVQVETGTSSSCARRAGGSVWCWGDNAAGQLGVADPGSRTQPAFVSLPASATLVSLNHRHGCALLSTGALYCWGENEEGQLGQSDVHPGADAPQPVPVTTDLAFRHVDTGDGHTCAIKADRSLWCWGRNVSGQLGLGSGAPIQVRTPTRVAGSDWSAVFAGQDHTCAFKTDGSLHCTGMGEFGQLGFGDRNARSTFERVGADTWSAFGTNTFVSCGIRGQGSLYCWGRNLEGQLGTGDLEDRVSPELVSDEGWALIGAGRFFTCAARRDQTIACTGDNIAGELGTGDLDRRNRFTNALVP
jgi:alpha-tubulin suppressor-like RCC1 family protein